MQLYEKALYTVSTQAHQMRLGSSTGGGMQLQFCQPNAVVKEDEKIKKRISIDDLKRINGTFGCKLVISC